MDRAYNVATRPLSPQPARGSYDCVRLASPGRTYAILHLNGMLGWALRTFRVSDDLRRISVSVSLFTPGPSQRVLRLLQTVLNCTRLVRVWLDDDLHVRDLTILTVWPLSGFALETLEKARNLATKMCDCVSPPVPLYKVPRSPVYSPPEPASPCRNVSPNPFEFSPIVASAKPESSLDVVSDSIPCSSDVTKLVPMSPPSKSPVPVSPPSSISPDRFSNVTPDYSMPPPLEDWSDEDETPEAIPMDLSLTLTSPACPPVPVPESFGEQLLSRPTISERVSNLLSSLSGPLDSPESPDPVPRSPSPTPSYPDSLELLPVRVPVPSSPDYSPTSPGSSGCQPVGSGVEPSPREVPRPLTPSPPSSSSSSTLTLPEGGSLNLSTRSSIEEQRDIEYMKLSMFRLGVLLRGVPQISMPVLDTAEAIARPCLCRESPLLCPYCGLRELAQLTPEEFPFTAICVPEPPSAFRPPVVTVWFPWRPSTRYEFRLLRVQIDIIPGAIVFVETSSGSRWLLGVASSCSGHPKCQHPSIDV